MNQIGLLQANPIPNPLPRMMTHQEAYDALLLEPKKFEVIVDDKEESISKLFDRLHGGDFPKTSIYIRHPDYYTLMFSNSNEDAPNDENTIWYMDRSSPIGKYGVMTRTNRMVHISPSAIWPSIEYWMSQRWYNMNSDAYVHSTAMNQVLREKTLKQKLDQMRVKALHSQAAEYGLPEDLEPLFASYIEARPYVKGFKTVPSNLRKIQSNLFTNGEVNVPRHLKKVNTTLFQGGKRKRKRLNKTRKQK